jgi:hypothetical protein
MIGMNLFSILRSRRRGDVSSQALAATDAAGGPGRRGLQKRTLTPPMNVARGMG